MAHLSVLEFTPTIRTLSARIDFEQRDGENFNFAGTRMSMGGLKKSYQEILEIVKANNPNVVTD